MLLETPCVLIDDDRLERNIEKMADLARRSHVQLRPHLKTHKSVKIAKMQKAAGAMGFTVAKISEAEVMADAGLDDFFIAYPIIGKSKIKRLLDLNRRCSLIVGVDSLKGALALSEAALQDGQELTVRLEFDMGFGRTGASPDQAVDLAQKISQMEALRFDGIFAFKAMTYAGHPTSDRKAAGLEEGQLAVEMADRIRASGIAVKNISVGSTPTAEYAASVEGITEIRPGTYVLNDMATVKSGSCTLDDCAAAVLVTIVSKTEDRLVIDGGSKTFSTDVQPGTAPLFLEGFGQIIGDDRLVLSRFSEEHGIITIKEGANDYQVGDTLLIVPNHICTTLNLHDTFVLTRHHAPAETIRVDARGCVF